MLIKRLLSLLLITIVISLFTVNTLTADNKQYDADGIPMDGVIYTLTYPDGTKVTEINGNPLTYNDVKDLLKEDNWILLASDLVSDRNGKVELPDTWTKGTIKIIETKVPEGYEVGDQEKIVKLEDGEVTFVNPKNKVTDNYFTITYKLNGGEYNGSSSDIIEEYLKGTIISVHEAPSKDGTKFLYWQGSSYYPGDKYEVVSDHTFTAIYENTVNKVKVPNTASNNFVIHKVDDNNEPVEGAVFDIYAKPDLTYTDLPVETISVNVTKIWDDNNNASRPDVDTFKSKLTLSNGSGIVDNSNLTVTDNGNDTYTCTWTDLPKYNNGKEITYTVTETQVDGYNDPVYKDGNDNIITSGAPNNGKITNTYSLSSTGLNVKLNFINAKYLTWDIVDSNTPITLWIMEESSGNIVDSKTVIPGIGSILSSPNLAPGRYIIGQSYLKECTIDGTELSKQIQEAVEAGLAATPQMDVTINEIEFLTPTKVLVELDGAGNVSIDNSYKDPNLDSYNPDWDSSECYQWKAVPNDSNISDNPSYNKPGAYNAWLYSFSSTSSVSEGVELSSNLINLYNVLTDEGTDVQIK